MGYTISEHFVVPFALTADQIRAWDIAWPLHQLVRYGGQIIEPYTVLDHIGLGCMMLVDLQVTSLDTHAAWMLHESGEAYFFGDMNGMIKRRPEMSWFCDREDEVTALALERFGIDRSQVDHALLQKIDEHCRYLELSWLFPTQANTPPVQQHKTDLKFEPRRLRKATPHSFVEQLRVVCPNASNPDTLYEVPRLVQNKWDVAAREQAERDLEKEMLSG